MPSSSSSSPSINIMIIIIVIYSWGRVNRGEKIGNSRWGNFRFLPHSKTPNEISSDPFIITILFLFIYLFESYFFILFFSPFFCAVCMLTFGAWRTTPSGDEGKWLRPGGHSSSVAGSFIFYIDIHVSRKCGKYKSRAEQSKVWLGWV